MARDGSGNFSLPANTLAVSGDPISSTKFNTLVQDLEADANVDRPIAAGGTGASTAAAARANLGLGNLSTVTASAFALTILDDVDAAAVRTTIGAGVGDMLKSENLSGLANYTTARSNLGLPIGTSGATVPLLNGANTWGNVQTFGNGGLVLNGDAGTNRQFLIQSGLVNRWAYGVGGLAESGSNAGTDYLIARFDDAGGFLDVPIFISRSTGAVLLSATPTVAGSTVWHAGNDGAGSGLDADTLDGVQGSAFATLAGSQTFTGAKDFTGGLQLSGVDVVSLSATQTLTNKTLTTPTINGGTIQSRAQAASETTGALTVASANRTIQATGDITIPNSVFTDGDIILIYAGASARTITQGSGVTMRLGGTATTGSRTLAARGVAMLFFVSASEVVVSGGAVT